MQIETKKCARDDCQNKIAGPYIQAGICEDCADAEWDAYWREVDERELSE